MNRRPRRSFRIRAYTPGRSQANVPGRDGYQDDLGNPWEGMTKREKIDMGLALLAVYCVPGTQYTLHEIAGWCGCSREAIRRIQERALEKLRARLGPEFRELLETMQ